MKSWPSWGSKPPASGSQRSPTARRCWLRSPPPGPAPQVVGSVAGQYLHGGDQLGAGVHHNRRLVPVEPPAAALVPMAHLRVIHQHHPVRAYPVLEAHSALSPFHVLEQQLPQQFRRRHNPLALSAFLPQFPLRLPRQLQQPVRVGHNLGQQRRPRLPVGPVDVRLALHAGAQVSLISPGLGPFPDRSLLHRRQHPQQFDDPVRQ